MQPGGSGSGGSQPPKKTPPPVPPKPKWNSGTKPTTGVTGQTGKPVIGTKPKWTPVTKPSSGVTGQTGKPVIGAKKTMGALNKATDPSQKAPTGVQDCPLKKHFVKVRLHFKDDDTPVPTTGAQILQGFATTNGGPLAAGILEATDLDANDYTIYFPDIDASEWEPA